MWTFTSKSLPVACRMRKGRSWLWMHPIERKAGREALRRDASAAQDAASLYGLIYPERHLQERIYSILPFLAKHGLISPAGSTKPFNWTPRTTG